MKKFILFLGLLIPWFIGALFSFDTSFYQEIALPFFAPPAIIFGIVWPILYLCIATSSYLILKEYGGKEKEYNKVLFINYIFNQLYPFFFFTLHSLLLSFIDTVALLISTLFLYYETKSLNKTSSKLLIPYVLWNLFALILSISIYFMNLSISQL